MGRGSIRRVCRRPQRLLRSVGRTCSGSRSRRWLNSLRAQWSGSRVASGSAGGSGWRYDRINQYKHNVGDFGGKRTCAGWVERPHRAAKVCRLSEPCILDIIGPVKPGHPTKSQLSGDTEAAHPLPRVGLPNSHNPNRGNGWALPKSRTSFPSAFQIGRRRRRIHLLVLSGQVGDFLRGVVAVENQSTITKTKLEGDRFVAKFGGGRSHFRKEVRANRSLGRLEFAAANHPDHFTGRSRRIAV